MNTKQLLDEREINKPKLKKGFQLKKIQKILKKAKNELEFKGLGKGKWNLIALSLDEEKIIVDSVCTEEIFEKIFEEILIPDRINLEIDAYLHSFKVEKDIEKELNCLTSPVLNISIEHKKSGDLNIVLKGEINLSKNSLLSFWENLYILREKLEIYNEKIEISLRSEKDSRMKISLDSDFGQIISNKRIIKKISSSLKNIFAIESNNLKAYILYAKIEEIVGGWSGKRKGKLIEERIFDEEVKQKEFSI